MVESYGKSGNTESTRRRTFALLRENPYFTAKTICEKLDLEYRLHGNYINKLKSEWRSYRQNEQVSNCSSIHNWRGWCLVPINLDRKVALEVGWVPTKAKNRWLLWKDNSGRLEWFENGRVNIYVRGPVNLGKVKQLVCNGFGFTGLIFEDRILQRVLGTIHPSGAHYVFEMGQALPRKTIDAFKESHGIRIKVGDESHPSGVEIISSVPNWVEKLESTLEKLDCLWSSSYQWKDSDKKLDYVI